MFSIDLLYIECLIIITYFTSGVCRIETPQLWRNTISDIEPRCRRTDAVVGLVL